jgi:hypothetical protein
MVWTKKKMYKFTLIGILLFSSCWISAQTDDLNSLVNSLLLQNSNYQKVLSTYQKEKALYSIDKSLDWFDMSFIYKQYDNDFTRHDVANSIEHSAVDEKDKRWSVELNKQLFSNDFNDPADALDSRLNLLRYKQEVKLTCSTASGEILNEMIDWYQADTMVSLLQSRLEILYHQNQLLEEMVQQNQLDSEKLIANLEDIDKKEAELSDLKKTEQIYSRKYGNILLDFMDKYQSYMNTMTQADTLQFKEQIESQKREIVKDFDKLEHKLRLYRYNFFLPEVNLTFSYNWRENRQKWDITQSNVLRKMTRNQDEEFPEGDIEVTMPFNIFSNSHGKSSLLKGYDMEFKYRSRDMMLSWQEYGIERLNRYQATGLELKRKKRLHELYENSLALQNRRYREEPALLGINPDLILQNYIYKAKEAQVEMKVAEMKLYKEIYLMNKLEEKSP